jgi:hypothetical protein
MVTYLSALKRLESLGLEFESPRSRPYLENRRPPLTRALLPVLHQMSFNGVSDYLEDLMARIDAPQLDWDSSINSYSTLHNSPGSSIVAIADKRTRHLVKFMWALLIRMCISHFLPVGWTWGFHADSQIGSFLLWRKSVARPAFMISFESFPRWNIYTSSVMDVRSCVGTMTSRTANGWNFYIHLLV